MEQYKCPACESPYGYELNNKIVCPECAFEWEIDLNAGKLIVKDSNGNLLEDGDTVVVIKDLPVKSAPKPIKAGTTIKKIRLVNGDHNIDCKIDGFGFMALKSEFVKKA
jgi:protein PhnA